jgi:TolB protein
MKGRGGSLIATAVAGTAAALIFVSLLLPSSIESATFPGGNGKIVFTSSRDAPGCFPQCGEVYRMGQDGASQTRLTNNAADDSHPAWSPDGLKIAFTSYRDDEGDIYLMNADGSGQTRLVEGIQPAWSPDGQKIVFSSGRKANFEIYVIGVDGTGLTRLTDDPLIDMQPVWSPDGQKIAFSSSRGGASYDVYTMNTDGTGVTKVTSGGAVDPNWSPDSAKLAFRNQRGNDIYTINSNGTGQTQLTTNPAADGDPTWSPDGAKIAFATNRDGNFEIYVMNVDGTGQTDVSNNVAQDTEPDWQTVRFPFPLSASPLSVSLVPLFRQCGTGGSPANGAHSPPLGGPSCLPPPPVSALARVGSQAVGSLQLTAVPGDQNPANGDQADLSIVASLTDIRTPAGADYSPNPSGPDLSAEARLRITDLRNGTHGDEAGTTTDLDFAAPIDCASTPSTSIGATCAANTSADALIPNYIKEGRRSLFQVFRVRINDPGANGVLGDADDRIFAHQGVYVP